MNAASTFPLPPLRRSPSEPILADRLVVKSAGHILFLSPSEITWIEAQGDYLKFHAGTHSCLVRMTMKEISERLDPRRFLGLHRSTIVNVDWISRISIRDDNRLVVILRDNTALLVSQGCRQKVRDFYEAGMRPRSYRVPDLRARLEEFAAAAPTAELASSV